MNDRTMIGAAGPGAETDFRTTLRLQGAGAIVWGVVAFGLSSGASLLHGGGSEVVQAQPDGVLFWSFVVAILTVEPVVSTALIGLLAILLSRAGLGRFVVVLTVAVVSSAALGIFDRGAAVVLFVPLLVYAYLFVDRNEGRGDYARGFVVAWFAQWVCNGCVALGLLVARAAG